MLTALSLVCALLAPAEDGLTGAWRATDSDAVWHFRDGQLIESSAGQQTVSAFALDGQRLAIVPHGPQPRRAYTLDHVDDALTLTGAGGAARTFERLDEVPERARIDPLPFGERTPDASERDALVSELAERVAVDQEVRRRYQEVAQELGPAAWSSPQPPELAEAVSNMLLIDRDNTAWLRAQVQDVGWFDGERFGTAAHHDAFLLVQHSGDLRLMRAALPRIEAALADDPSSGQSFALLSDRTRLALGQTQLYGSQLWGRDGVDGYVVPRLEDPDGVDARRAALGMPSLEAYLGLFRADGTTVVVEAAADPDAAERAEG